MELTVVILFLSVPAGTYAALNAGVVNGVWFSDPNPNAGQKVRIFTAVQNTSGETVSGTVAFLVNGDIVGSAPFTVGNNDVRAVSVPYVFEDGAYEVSAYITSSQEENVVYTIAPDTSVSVAPRTKPTGQDEALSGPASLERATTSLAVVTETLAATSENVLARVEPMVESAAQSVESFRNNLLETLVKETKEQDMLSNLTAANESFVQTPTKKEAAKNFVVTSKAIVSSESISLWEKTVGVMLSALALAIRFWFVFLVWVIGLAFWLLIRGRRIF